MQILIFTMNYFHTKIYSSEVSYALVRMYMAHSYMNAMDMLSFVLCIHAKSFSGLFVCLSVCLSVCLPACPSACLS